MATSVNLSGSWPGSGEGGGTACFRFGQFRFPAAMGVTKCQIMKQTESSKKEWFGISPGEKQTLGLKLIRSLRHESAVTVTASFRGDKDGAFAGCLK